jgi:hypothetical protein
LGEQQKNARTAVATVLRELATEWQGLKLGFADADAVLRGLAANVERQGHV